MGDQPLRESASSIEIFVLVATLSQSDQCFILYTCYCTNVLFLTTQTWHRSTSVLRAHCTSGCLLLSVADTHFCYRSLFPQSKFSVRINIPMQNEPTNIVTIVAPSEAAAKATEEAIEKLIGMNVNRFTGLMSVWWMRKKQVLFFGSPDLLSLLFIFCLCYAVFSKVCSRFLSLFFCASFSLLFRCSLVSLLLLSFWLFFLFFSLAGQAPPPPPAKSGVAASLVRRTKKNKLWKTTDKNVVFSMR